MEELKSRITLLEECAGFYKELFSSAEVVIPEKGYLPLPDRFDIDGVRRAGRDALHASTDPSFLSLGYGKIAETAEENAKKQDGEEKKALEVTAEIFRGASGYIRAHAEKAKEAAEAAQTDEEKARLNSIADSCFAVAEGAPQSFEEAVTLFWITWRIRSLGNTSTIGRLDKYLLPFYRKSVKEHGLTREAALLRLVDLWERINGIYSGDSLINIMLGGSDKDGNDETNELSYLMLDAELQVRKSEPHLNVRIHKNTPEDFIEKVAQVQMLGHGQATVFADDLTIKSLISYGYTPEQAANYSNDGCVELTIDGGGLIDFFQMEAMKSLELAIFNGDENVHFDSLEYYWTHRERKLPVFTYLKTGYRTGDVAQMQSYEEFYRAFFDQYTYQLKIRLDDMRAAWKKVYAEEISSVFLEGLYPAFLKNGIDLAHNKDVPWTVMVFLGSIPTVADCLAAVKKVVFEDKNCSFAELREALHDNWEGHDDLRALCKAAPKFGNDDDYVDMISADLANEICDWLDEYNKENGTRILPALYDFLFSNHEKIVGATPDGRKWKDRICEHYSPTPGVSHLGPTKIINSSAKGPLARAVGTSPLYLSLPRSLITDDRRGLDAIIALNKSAIEKGICVFNLAIYDIDLLREAQAHPEGHEDIVVRVWGYCARFIDLQPDIQNHVIARVEGFK